jgi:hypothetical protein
LTEYAFWNFNYFAGQEFTAVHEYGLLAIAVAGVALWIFTGSQERQTTLFLHSTQLISGALFILVGILMLNGTLAAFNSLLSPDLALWFSGFEDRLINFFSGE